MEDGKVSSTKEFCEKLSLHQQVYYDIRSNKRSVTIEMLSDLLNIFNINPSWILDNKGEIYVTNSNRDFLSNFDSLNQILHEPELIFGKSKGVPFFENALNMDKINLSNNDHYKIYVPGFEDCTSALVLPGESMKPTYFNGDILMLKQIFDLNVIKYGEAYLIVTSDGLKTVKYIRKHEDPKLVTLQAENPAFDSFEIFRNSITELHIVKGSIRRNGI